MDNISALTAVVSSRVWADPWLASLPLLMASWPTLSLTVLLQLHKWLLNLNLSSTRRYSFEYLYTKQITSSVATPLHWLKTWCCHLACCCAFQALNYSGNSSSHHFAIKNIPSRTGGSNRTSVVLRFGRRKHDLWVTSGIWSNLNPRVLGNIPINWLTTCLRLDIRIIQFSFYLAASILSANTRLLSNQEKKSETFADPTYRMRWQAAESDCTRLEPGKPSTTRRI